LRKRKEARGKRLMTQRWLLLPLPSEEFGNCGYEEGTATGLGEKRSSSLYTHPFLYFSAQVGLS